MNYFARLGLNLAPLVLLTACASQPEAPPEVASSVDLNRYAGQWYEFARIPQPYERGCVATTAEYRVIGPQQLQVINRCHQAAFDGPIRQVSGTAKVVEPSTNAKLLVNLGQGPPGDYWILKVGPEYHHALVGTPDRTGLWVLSRQMTLDYSTYNDLLQIAKARGYDISLVRLTPQPLQMPATGPTTAPN